MEASQSNFFKSIKEIIVPNEDEAWKIFINFIKELNSLKDKYIKYNLNPDLILIVDENNAKINIIDLALSNSGIKEENNINNENINKMENIDNNNVEKKMKKEKKKKI